jgi:hypothetical protein
VAADLGTWPAEQATVLLEVLHTAGLHPEARRGRDGVHVTRPRRRGRPRARHPRRPDGHHRQGGTAGWRVPRSSAPRRRGPARPRTEEEGASVQAAISRQRAATATLRHQGRFSPARSARSAARGGVPPRRHRRTTHRDLRPRRHLRRPRLDARTQGGRRPLSSPVSSCGGHQESLVAAVLVGVVGDAVLPAAPDDADPGSGEDADGVGVAQVAGSGSGVDVGGPG